MDHHRAGEVEEDICWNKGDELGTDYCQSTLGWSFRHNKCSVCFAITCWLNVEVRKVQF
jgi:hypothetical protein